MCKPHLIDRVAELVQSIFESMPSTDPFYLPGELKEKETSRSEPQISASTVNFESLCNNFMRFSRAVTENLCHLLSKLLSLEETLLADFLIQFSTISGIRSYLHANCVQHSQKTFSDEIADFKRFAYI